MQLSTHTMPQLFEQLGLPGDEESIQRFVIEHRPLPEGTKLADAPFWSAGQKQFLREQFIEDADWAEVVDQLNMMLND